MCQRLTFCLFILIGLTVNAQTTINLHGTVSNQAAKPIAGAIVTLVKQQLKDTTGADGSYKITNSNSAISPLLIPRNQTILLDRGFLELSLTNPSPVKIEIFDAKGILLKKEYLQNAQTGFYRFNIAENSNTTKLLIIRASIGQNEATFRYLSLQSGKYMANQSNESSTRVGSKLAKIAAVDDTLRTAAIGYKTKVTAITSYDQELNITLDTTGSDVTVQLDQTKQEIAGFGINNTYQSGGFSDQVADALFDSTKGLGLTILRIGMNSSGGNANGSNPQDIAKAKARGAKYIIGSTWSPPGSYKTNGSENNGGHVKPANYEQWATTIANFAKNNNLYAMSVGNEPDFASCGSAEPCNGNYATTLYTGDEMAAFVKVAGPKIHNAGSKLMAPEASEWCHLWSDTSACCSEPSHKNSSDPLGCGFPPSPTKCPPGKGYDYGHALYRDKEAWALLDIVGIHQYDSQRAQPWPADVPEKKPVWQTEMSGVKWWPEQGPSTDINNGVAVAEWFHNALTVGEAAAWCWWWWNGSSTNEGLQVNGQDTKRHWTFGNFTRFVRPGFIRVDITGNIPNNILISAYKGSGNRLVVVAINKGTTSATVPITVAGGTAPTSMTPWVTSASDNLKPKDEVTVSNGTFTATLAGKTVTTFVGK